MHQIRQKIQCIYCEQKMYESSLKCECMEDLTEHHVLCERDML